MGSGVMLMALMSTTFRNISSHDQRPRSSQRCEHDAILKILGSAEVAPDSPGARRLMGTRSSIRLNFDLYYVNNPDDAFSCTAAGQIITNVFGSTVICTTADLVTEDKRNAIVGTSDLGWRFLNIAPEAIAGRLQASTIITLGHKTFLIN